MEGRLWLFLHSMSVLKSATPNKQALTAAESVIETFSLPMSAARLVVLRNIASLKSA